MNHRLPNGLVRDGAEIDDWIVTIAEW